jgi:hypothetical protein
MGAITFRRLRLATNKDLYESNRVRNGGNSCQVLIFWELSVWFYRGPNLYVRLNKDKDWNQIMDTSFFPANVAFTLQDRVANKVCARTCF